METLNTIIPIFAVILLGLLAKKRGFIPPSFVSPANRLTYYLAIPALIFRAIAKSDFHTKFDSWLLMGTLLPLLIVYGVFWIVFLVLGVASKSRGTLIESTIHGNIGYIALATAGILAGFVMLTHNSLAVIVLQLHSGNQGTGHGMKQILTKIIGNPIILTAIVSILFSLAQLQIPVIIDRTLAVIGNLALPLALLLIGASLSFRIQTRQLFLVLMVSFAKLIVLPALGLWFYVAFHLQPEMYLPGLILLSAPVATVSYILATEMNGDPKMAVSIISISTALSALSITFWLAITV
jgi:hypothetical protein